MAISLLDKATWHNEPKHWSIDDEQLRIATDNETDFWQKTYYGFTPDNGHFFGADISGDFCVQASFSGQYEELYDQAGLMLRAGTSCWVKAGIEYSDQQLNFSVVVTDGLSDWSVIPVPNILSLQSIRLCRVDKSILVHCRQGDADWQLMRVANFDAPETIKVGPMACSPKRQGFEALFHQVELVAMPDDPLHGP